MASAYFQQMLAIIAAGAGGVAYPYRKTNEGVFMISRTGEIEKTASSAVGGGDVPIGGYLTSHLCVKAPAHFDEVALVFGNATGSARTISGFSVAPGATMDDMTNSAAAGRANFVAGSFGGSPGATIGAGTDALCTYVKSDFIACSSVARAAGDAATWSIAGGKLADTYVEPLLHIRVAFPIDGGDQSAANNTPMLGTINFKAVTAENPFNPPQPSASGRFLACTQSSNASPQLSVGSATALSGTVYGPFTGIVFCPVIGVVFKFRGNVISVATAGDSISEGAGLTGDRTIRPWSLVGPEKSSSMSEPITHMPLYKSGQSSTTYLAYLSNCISQGLVPTHAVFPVGTPNDGGVNLTNLATFFSLCATHDIHPVVWTTLPVGQVAPQKYTDPATELARIAANNSVRNGTVTAGTYSWMEMELPSLTDGATPYASIPAPLSDAIRLHPNNDGNAIMEAVFEDKLADLQSEYFP